MPPLRWYVMCRGLWRHAPSVDASLFRVRPSIVCLCCWAQAVIRHDLESQLRDALDDVAQREQEVVALRFELTAVHEEATGAVQAHSTATISLRQSVQARDEL